MSPKIKDIYTKVLKGLLVSIVKKHTTSNVVITCTDTSNFYMNSNHIINHFFAVVKYIQHKISFPYVYYMYVCAYVFHWIQYHVSNHIYVVHALQAIIRMILYHVYSTKIPIFT